MIISTKIKSRKIKEKIKYKEVAKEKGFIGNVNINDKIAINKRFSVSCGCFSIDFMAEFRYP